MLAVFSESELQFFLFFMFAPHGSFYHRSKLSIDDGLLSGYNNVFVLAYIIEGKIASVVHLN